MKIYSWETEGGNFGDDLNQWLWPELMPGDWPECNDVLLCGVGTILTTDLPQWPKLVVLGSGAGYSALPNDMGQPWMRCYGFRGPLSTRICGLDQSKTLGDPAILIPDLLKPDTSSPGKILFVPHVHSAKRANWAEVCKRAGVAYLDPRGDSKAIIATLASARLVLAESMHAAIIADAYRVPWIPVWSSREISYFKWVDWALAVGAQVVPQQVCPPSRLSYLDHQFAALASNANTNFAELNTKRITNESHLVDELKRMSRRRSGSAAKLLRKNYLRARKRIFIPLLNKFGESESRIDQAANTLKQLSSREGYLSNESSLEQAKNRLRNAIELLKKDRQNEFADLPSRHQNS